MFTRATLAALGLALGACTLILTPNENDDGVARCGNTDECPELQDNRFQAACVQGADQADDSDKVCAATFKEPPCNPEAFSGQVDHPYFDAWETAQGQSSAYNCTTDNFGKRGCPALGGACEGDLVLNADDVCDVDGAAHPAVRARPELAGVDVRDQYCRWYFCDDSFVCNSAGGKFICEPCNRNAEIGEGGCGELYVEGELSSVYLSGDALSSACNNGSKGTAESVFGPSVGG